MAQKIVWSRRSDEFAYKLNLEIPKGNPEVVVEHGTQVLFFRDGEFIRVFGPGGHKLQSFIERIFHPKEMSLIWIDTGALFHHFRFENIRTCDNIPLAIEIQLTLSLEEPSLFCVNVLKAKKNYTRKELNQYLFGELINSVEEFIALRPIGEINTTRDFKNIFEASIQEHIYHSLKRDGFRILQVRAANFFNPKIERLKDTKANFEISHERHQLEKQTLEEENLSLRQQMASHLQRKMIEVAHDKKQAILEEQTEDVEHRQQIAKLERESRISDYIDDFEVKRLQKKRRKERMKQRWHHEEKSQDQLAEFARQKNLMQHRHEMETRQNSHRHRLELQRQNFLQEQEIGEQQHRLELNRNLLEANLEEQQMKIEGEEAKKDCRLAREMSRKIHQVTMESKVNDIALETQKKRAEMALNIQQKMMFLQYQKQQYQNRLEKMRQASQNKRLKD